MKTTNLLIATAFLMFNFSFFISSAQTFQKTFGSGQGGFNNKSDYATSVKQTVDGGYIAAGYSDGSGLGLDDIYLVRFNASGDTLWSKVYGGSNKEYGRSVVQTTDGGFAVCGETQTYGVFKNDVFLLKTNSSGTLLWAKTYGGSDEDYGYSMQQTTDGGFIIAGKTLSFGQVGGYEDVYIIKTDSSGNVAWTKTYGGAYDDAAHSIQQTTDGGYIIAGEEGSFQYGILLMKLNSSGDSSWSKSIRGNYGGYYGNSVRQTADGGYAVTGYTTDAGYGSYDIFLFKTDGSGTLVFTKAFGSSSLDEGRSVKQTNDGGYIFTGYTYAGSSYSQFHTFKTDASGVMQWNKVYRSNYGNEGSDLIQTNDGGYAMAGYIYNNFGNTLAGVYQSYDAYIVKTDSTGNSPGCVAGATGLMTGSLTWNVYNCAMIKSSGATQNSAAMNNKFSKTRLDDAAVKMNFTVDNVLCDGACNGTIAINTCDTDGFYCSGTAPYVYQWNSATGNQTNATATALCAGTFSVIITDNFGCKGVDSTTVSIEAIPQDICLVTVDSTSTKNLVIWEKPVVIGIDSFKIYREIGLNNYVHIGSVAYSALSEFTDNTNGINPKAQSYRYKISALDTCGNESALSSHHRTIHLSTPQYTPPSTFDLIWTNDYEGFSISGYTILRDGFGTGIWDSIVFVTYGNLSYTDFTAPSADARYIVEANHPTGCDATLKVKKYNASKSNTAATTIMADGEMLQEDERVVIFPNPTTGKFEVSGFISYQTGQVSSLEIFNVFGEVVYKAAIKNLKSEINLSSHSAGVYMLQIQTNTGIERRKIIKQ